MRTFTAQETKKINEINGTLETRAEYLEKVAEIVGGEIGNGHFHYNVNCVNRIVVDNVIIDISTEKGTTKATKNQRFITYISVTEFNENGNLVDFETYAADKKTKQFEIPEEETTEEVIEEETTEEVSEGETKVERGDIVEIDGEQYRVTATENYGFFVKGKRNIILWTDKYKVIA